MLGGPCHQTYFQDLTACFFYAVSFHCNPRVSIKLRLALQQTCANIAEKVLLAIQIINAVVFFSKQECSFGAVDPKHAYSHRQGRVRYAQRPTATRAQARKLVAAVRLPARIERRGHGAGVGGTRRQISIREAFPQSGHSQSVVAVCNVLFARPATCKLLMRIPIVTARWSEK